MEHYRGKSSRKHQTSSSLNDGLQELHSLEVLRQCKQAAAAAKPHKDSVFIHSLAVPPPPQTISTIFTVEVASSRWMNLITDLTGSTSTSVSIEIRKAAILTLGQICDKLKEFKLGKQGYLVPAPFSLFLILLSIIPRWSAAS